MEIIIGKIKIKYDKENILNNISKWKYNEEDYNGKGCYFDDDSFSYSEEEFIKSKNIFIDKVGNIFDDITSIEKYIKVNKNGSINGVSRQEIISFDCVSNYNNEYGSHSYYVNCLKLKKLSDFEGELILDSYKEQSSF